MAFFKSLQQNLPSVSSLVDTISNAVEDLTAAVGEVSYAFTDSVAEQVTSMINGFRPEEESSAAPEAADTSKQESTTTAIDNLGKRTGTFVSQMWKIK